MGRMRTLQTFAAVGFAFMMTLASTSLACMYHEFSLSYGGEPVKTVTLASPALTLSAAAAANATVSTTSDPAIFSWKQNLTGLTGSSPNATINTIVSAIPADVQTVAFDL